MQIENDYDNEVYNGDLGIVSRIDLGEGELAVDFEGREVVDGVGELDELVLAYATTIHKRQGSELFENRTLSRSHPIDYRVDCDRLIGSGLPDRSHSALLSFAGLPARLLT
jgi:hypothetical protein